VGFSGLVIVELLDDGIRVRVIAPFAYADSKGRVWTVPAGFVSDCISLPVWAYTALDMTPFTTKARVPALLHDWAYSELGMDKDEADLLSHEACISADLATWEADIGYARVHIGGEAAFSQDQLIAAAKAGAVAPTA
jgi:hypothetical protein